MSAPAYTNLRFMENEFLASWKAALGFVPVERHLFFLGSVEADLHCHIRIGVSVVEVAALSFLIELDEHFFVEPRRCAHLELSLFEALKRGPFFERLEGGMFLVVLHEQSDDLQGLVFHALDIKVHL